MIRTMQLITLITLHRMLLPLLLIIVLIMSLIAISTGPPIIVRLPIMMILHIRLHPRLPQKPHIICRLIPPLIM